MGYLAAPCSGVRIFVCANLFSEYGALDTQPVIDTIAAVVFVLFAVFLGTLPARRWYAKRRGDTLLLMAVGLMAAWLPARRASRIDPWGALRAE